MSDWAEQFVPFSLFHLATVAALVALMIAACALGRWCRGTLKERRFRQTWGWAVLAYQTWFTLWYFDGFQWEVSLPLHLCDLAAFVAGAAMVWQKRWMRTLLYFWGIGLSTQAFFTPILRLGWEHLHFWMFWIGHLAIVGSAVYDVVVGGYRPLLRDLRVAILVSVGYVMMAVVVNMTLDRAGVLPEGVRANYGYVGATEPRNPTIVDRLGPWPWRILVMSAIVIVDYVILWGVWPMARRLTGRADPLACASCGHDLAAVSSRAPCPACGAPPKPPTRLPP